MAEPNYTKTGIVPTDDIVAYLRAFAAYEGEGASLMDDAADEIERLRALADQLAHALRAEMPNIPAPLSNRAIDAYDKEARGA